VRTGVAIRTWFVAAAIAVLVLPCAALTASRTDTRPAATPKWVTTAKQRLARLDVREPGSMVGYSRAKFGRAWEDVDLNRCDARNDMLARDLRQVVGEHLQNGEAPMSVAAYRA
jgi:hypothetical protein